MQTAIAENSRMALEQNEYERRYADLTERYNTIKADYDKISEQIESKKAQRELFKGFIRALEKQGALVEEFDEGLWSSLVQKVVVKSPDLLNLELRMATANIGNACGIIILLRS